MKHLKYARYLFLHKLYVALACLREGLWWRAFSHDLSKFLPGEWGPYANFFYGEKPAEVRDSTGYYKPTDTGDSAFDFAWLLHQKKNRHHWQWWLLPEDEGGVKLLPMPYVCVLEMICDWYGAGRAQMGGLHKGWDSVADWWVVNQHKMQIHKATFSTIDQLLGSRVSVEWQARQPK